MLFSVGFLEDCNILNEFLVHIPEDHVKIILSKVLVPTINIQDLLNRLAIGKKFAYHQFVYDYVRTVTFTKVYVCRSAKNDNIVMVSRVKVTFTDAMGSREIECWMKPKDPNCRDTDRQTVMSTIRLIASDSFIEKYLNLKNNIDSIVSQHSSDIKQSLLT